jgi:exodeoxyribonuclease VIII
MIQVCIPDLSNEDYHSRKEFISRSALMDFDKSPYTYWAKHLNPDRPKKDATSSMILGSAFHTLALEPKLFDDQYIMKPAPMLLKDVGREAYNIYKNAVEYIETCGKIVLSTDEYNNLGFMLLKLQANKDAMHLIRDAHIENSFFWKDEHSGLLLKARPDILHDNMIVDLKTTSNASPRHFQREMVDYGYHIQFAMIRDAVEIIEGRRINNCINIVIETKYPYNMAIYIIDEFALDEGQLKYKQLCLDLKNAIEENDFKDYGIQTIGLPKWAL